MEYSGGIIFWSLIENKKQKITKPLEQFENPIEDIVVRGNIDTPNAHIHNSTLSWLDTDTSIKSGGVKLVFSTQIFLF